MTQLLRKFAPPFLLLVPVLLVGCGKGGTGTVSGDVKYRGEPLPGGNITFISEVGDKQVVSAPIRDGKYSVTGVPAGPAKITVQTSPPPRPATLPPGVKPIQPSGGEAAPPPPGKYVPIPTRYNTPDQSGLAYTVKRGSQEHPITLE